MAGVKVPHEDEDYGGNLEDRATKAKRHDLEPPPMDDVDIKLAEKLDSILKLSETRKPKFFMNKTRASGDIEVDQPTSAHTANRDHSKLRPRNLSREELRERLLRKYETLVPELDPQRPKVNLVKILSNGESLEMAKNQAKRQLERQLELNSVSKNQEAYSKGISSFRFNDGYEMPTERRYPAPTRSTPRTTTTNSGVALNKKPISKNNSQSNQSNPMIDEGEKLPTRGSKSVKFAMDAVNVDNESNQSKNNHTNEEKEEDDDDDDEISTDDLTESDYTTTGDEDEGNGCGRVEEID